MPDESRYRMVRFPEELAQVVEQIAAELFEAHQTGKTTRVRITEQGSKGSWVSIPEAVRVMALDYVDHKKRSKRSKAKAK